MSDIELDPLPLASAEMIQNALERVAAYLDADDMAWSIRNGLGETRSCSLALEARAAAERMKAHVGDAIVNHYHAQREDSPSVPQVPIIDTDEQLREVVNERFGHTPLPALVADPEFKTRKVVDSDAQVIE